MTKKIYVHFPTSNKAAGGGYNFLRGLKAQWEKHELLSETPQGADIILYNSHHFLDDLFKMRRDYPQKKFIQRIDGPMSIYNKKNDIRDKFVKISSRALADGIIYQSSWSKDQNIACGITSTISSTVIHNAPSENFFRSPREEVHKKIRLISSCWSTNQNKGHDTYKWIDTNLDFSKYEFTLVGRSPYQFKNIKMAGPYKHNELIKSLHESDIYIFPSRFEACSNSLTEAFYANLPVIAYNGSSNTELVQSSGILFKDDSEIPNCIEKITSNYLSYQQADKRPGIEGIAKKYNNFFNSVKLRERDNSSSTFKAQIEYNYLKYKNKIVSRLYRD